MFGIAIAFLLIHVVILGLLSLIPRYLWCKNDDAPYRQRKSFLGACVIFGVLYALLGGGVLYQNWFQLFGIEPHSGVFFALGQSFLITIIPFFICYSVYEIYHRKTRKTEQENNPWQT